jgi:hypothetical protein
MSIATLIAMLSTIPACASTTTLIAMLSTIPAYAFYADIDRHAPQCPRLWVYYDVASVPSNIATCMAVRTLTPIEPNTATLQP